ncbi:hypothetical protein VIBNISOn1_1050051 [Vibrio nigripulchritudo SOn1]|uniref:Uncharacterized protein n=1 Tax=Vibrio nigripulchritudo SOn1 TaxID=1238450 RepID=A0AAV2VHP8_9VIBR|nr:hypothetical protein [Vibrio nigripulchritudo]CCO44225.1 hypothetical protein VIBNISOn1_1050051 [Vibrio nigripulchritudo SOn1]
MPCENCINDICESKCKRQTQEPVVSPYYIGEPKHEGEPDLLEGNESQLLRIGGVEYQAPITGWTHELIHKYCVAYAQHFGSCTCWDIYIGSQWVGSTEI